MFVREENYESCGDGYCSGKRVSGYTAVKVKMYYCVACVVLPLYFGCRRTCSNVWR